MREGYDRIATNNIIIYNGLHPHVWYPNSGDVFSRNIVFKAYSPAIMNKAIPTNGKWGKMLDSNFYVANKSVMTKYIANGCDSNSINGDAGFVNPAAGDYGLSPDSQVRSIGFIPFAMDNFGVRKSTLKAIAKKPVFPEAVSSADADMLVNGRKYAVWAQAKLWTPKGEEFSAFGIDFSSTGVALDGITEAIPSYQLGFRNGDLIIMAGEMVIKNINDLRSYLQQNGNQKMHLFILIRNQQKLRLTVTASLPVILD
jgi:hypothetical protein